MMMSHIVQHGTKLVEKADYVVQNCIVTVPARWDKSKREQAVKACQDGGISGKIITIDEPLAAIMPFKDRFKGQKVNIMVFHFGGCTSEFSICTNNNKKGEWKVQESVLVPFLGGHDINKILVEDLLEKLREEQPD